MTAREDLIHAIENFYHCTCGGGGCPTAELLVDAYAHELAEKQRSVLEGLMGTHKGDSDPLIPLGAIAALIDLIDPEKP